MKMLKPWFQMLTVGLSVSVLAAGCSSGKPVDSKSGSGDANANKDGKTKQEKVVVDLWWNASQSTPTDANSYKAIELYNQTHPNVEVRTQSIPYDQLRQKVIASANAGNAPDVTIALAEWVPEFNKMGILADLTNDVNQWPDKKAIPDSVWSADTIDGKIVGIPQYIGIRATVSHTEMLKKAGISEPPKTWDELLDVGKKLKAQGLVPYGISGKSVRSPQELIVYLWQNGTDIAIRMPDGKYRNTWNDDPNELKKAAGVLEFYKKMMDEGIISKDQTNWGYQEMDTNFAQGKVAMVQDGSWMVNYEKENPETMKDAKVTAPVYSKQPATYLEVASVLTYKASKHHKEAVDFMLWWAGKDAQSTVFKSRSVRSDVVEPGKWGEDFTKLVSQGKIWPQVALGGITQSMIDALQYVLLGKKNPEESAKWLSDQVNKSLKENNDLSGK